MSQVIDAAYQLVRAYPGGSASLAPRMGKSSTTLSHEVKCTGTAKFGLDDAVTATALSGDLRILNAFAAEVGCMVLPMPEQATEAPIGSHIRHVGALANGFGQLVSSVTRASDDGCISANELARLRGEWASLIAAGQALMTNLQAQHEACRPCGARAPGSAA